MVFKNPNKPPVLFREVLLLWFLSSKRSSLFNVEVLDEPKPEQNQNEILFCLVKHGPPQFSSKGKIKYNEIVSGQKRITPGFWENKQHDSPGVSNLESSAREPRSCRKRFQTVKCFFFDHCPKWFGKHSCSLSTAVISKADLSPD